MIKATAFILIGGKSKRFGSPKWAATIDRQTILDQTWDLCDNFENRFVAGKKKPDSISYPFVKDELEIQSPINGIYSALNHSDSDWNFIISCDLPLMTNEIIQSIWKSGKHNADAIVPMVNDYFQLTCAFYHKRILKQIQRQIEDGDLSLHGLL
ncbi:MAG: molybdenum cofactor guanylyltransferase, partial [bacterium]